jgi:hypothetical protein
MYEYFNIFYIKQNQSILLILTHLFLMLTLHDPKVEIYKQHYKGIYLSCLSNIIIRKRNRKYHLFPSAYSCF